MRNEVMKERVGMSELPDCTATGEMGTVDESLAKRTCWWAENGVRGVWPGFVDWVLVYELMHA